MFRLLAVTALVATLAFPAMAGAGALSDAAAKAEKLAADGKLDEAYDTMRAATAELGQQRKLSIRRAMFVTEKPVAYGSTSGAPGNTFPVGSTLITYTEPVGLKWVKENDATVTTRFTVDFELRNPAGELLASQKAFGNFALVSREPLQEIYSPLTLDVSQIPKGDYVVRYIFTDLNSKETAQVDQPFTLK